MTFYKTLGFDLLVELGKDSKKNFSKISQYLLEFNKENKLNNWNYTPELSPVFKPVFEGICDYIHFVN